MKLNLIERIELINRLPKEEKFTTLIVFKDFKKKIGITQKEISDFNIENVTNEDGQPALKYNTKALEPINFKLTDMEVSELKAFLQPLAESDKFPESLLDIYSQLIK